MFFYNPIFKSKINETLFESLNDSLKIKAQALRAELAELLEKEHSCGNGFIPEPILTQFRYKVARFFDELRDDYWRRHKAWLGLEENSSRSLEPGYSGYLYFLTALNRYAYPSQIGFADMADPWEYKERYVEKKQLSQLGPLIEEYIVFCQTPPSEELNKIILNKRLTQALEELKDYTAVLMQDSASLNELYAKLETQAQEASPVQKKELLNFLFKTNHLLKCHLQHVRIPQGEIQKYQDLKNQHYVYSPEWRAFGFGLMALGALSVVASWIFFGTTVASLSTASLAGIFLAGLLLGEPLVNLGGIFLTNELIVSPFLNEINTVLELVSGNLSQENVVENSLNL